MDKHKVLELSGVGRNFGGLKAVDNVTMSVDGGTTHVIIGPNGAGKTTLFSLISGELELSSGQISLFGEDVTRASATRRARQGMSRTYQITDVFTELTVEQTLLLAIRGRSGSRLSLFKKDRPDESLNERIARLLEKCGLLDRRLTRVGDMSYGEQRLLELAIALANEPRILLLDEPAAGLSPAERGPMAETIRGLSGELTILLIEHDMELALSLADQVTCLYYGALLATGTPAQIRADAKVQEVYFGGVLEHA